MEMSFSMIKARIGETPDPAERRRAKRVPVELHPTFVKDEPEVG